VRAISFTLFKLNQGYTEEPYSCIILFCYFIDVLDINLVEITYEVTV